MVPLLNNASLLQEMEGDERQGIPRGRSSKTEDVKLPVVVGLLSIKESLSEEHVRCCAAGMGFDLQCELLERSHVSYR